MQLGSSLATENNNTNKKSKFFTQKGLYTILGVIVVLSIIYIFVHYLVIDIVEQNNKANFNIPVTVENPVIVKPEPTTESASKCVRAGCSSELCVDNTNAENTFSTCIYKGEYSCYEQATCEIQANGECGWTMNDQLTSCLNQYVETESPGVLQNVPNAP